jgi:hypothetical protein
MGLDLKKRWNDLTRPVRTAMAVIINKLGNIVQPDQNAIDAFKARQEDMAQKRKDLKKIIDDALTQDISQKSLQELQTLEETLERYFAPGRTEKVFIAMSYAGLAVTASAIVFAIASAPASIAFGVCGIGAAMCVPSIIGTARERADRCYSEAYNRTSRRIRILTKEQQELDVFKTKLDLVAEKFGPDLAGKVVAVQQLFNDKSDAAKPAVDAKAAAQPTAEPPKPAQ